MKIAILGAMQEEIQPLLEYFVDHIVYRYAQNDYYEINYKDVTIYIVYSKIGKVNSTLTATILAEKFGCEYFLFSGVAGSLNKDLQIGDLIVAQKLYQHDLDISSFGHKVGIVPGNDEFYKSDEKLIKLASKVADKKGLKLRLGNIATGDQFIDDPKKKSWIKEYFKCDAIEMEGCSVAFVCNVLKKPCLILRSISDDANNQATVDFDKFLKDSASVSAEFMIAIVDELINEN